MSAENEKLDQMAEGETRKQILQLIEKNTNKKHFNEKRLDIFFEKCWQLKNPKEFPKESERFFRFIYDDLKVIIQVVGSSQHFADLCKFVVFFGANDDPELLEMLSDCIQKKIRSMQCDQILTILVNFAHTLDPNAQELFTAANQEFGQRLRGEFEQMDASLILKPEHIIKILNVLLSHGQLQEELTEEIVIHLEAHRAEYTPESLAELSIIYATKMPHAQLRNQFFDNMLTKFEKFIDYIDEKTLYKFLWSFIRAGRLVIE